VPLEQLIFPQLVTNYPHFYETEVSERCSVGTATCLYPVPDQSSPRLPNYYF